MRKILLIDLGGIGDLLILQPAVRALRQACPDAQIDIVVVRRCADLVKRYALFDTVFVFSTAALAAGLWLRLRRQAYDAAVNLRSMISWPAALKMCCLFALIAPRTSIGRDTSGRGFFYGVKISESEPSRRYAMAYDIEAVAALGATVTDRTIRFAVSPQERQRLDALLGRCGVQAQRLVVIHPGGMPSRRWPLTCYRQLCQRIQQAFPVAVAVTGSRQEAPLAKALVAQPGVHCLDLTGQLGLGELAALIERSALFISNDTGPMHLAAGLAARQIAIFGPGDLVQFDPRQINPAAVVLYRRSAACAPCNKPACASLRCLKEISVDEVFQAAQRLLAQQESV